MFKVGDRVKYINNDHTRHPDWYPCKGTIGTVISIIEDSILVQWPEGSTSSNDMWYAYKQDVQLVTESKMTRAKFEEIVAKTLKNCILTDWQDCKYDTNREQFYVCQARYIADELIKAHKAMKNK